MGWKLALALCVAVFALPSAAAAADVVGEATFAGGPTLQGAVRLTTGDGALDLSDAIGEGSTLRWESVDGRIAGTRGTLYADSRYSGSPFEERLSWAKGGVVRWACLPGCRAVVVADGMGEVGLGGNVTGRLRPEPASGRGSVDVFSGATIGYEAPARGFVVSDDGQHLKLRDSAAVIEGEVRLMLWNVEATVLDGGQETLVRTGMTREERTSPATEEVEAAWLEVTLRGARVEGPATGAVLVAGALDWSLAGALSGVGANGWIEAAGERHELRDAALRVEGETSGAATPTGAVAVAAERAGGAFAGSATRVVVDGRHLVQEGTIEPAALVATGAAATLLILVWVLLKGGALTALYSRLMRGSVLEHPTRRAVFEHVKTNPGAHIAELSRALVARRVTLRHHLRMLEAHGFVSARASGRVMTYFPAGEAPSAPRIEAQVALKGETRQLVLHAIRSSGAGATQRDLVERTGLSQRLVSYHLAQLEAVGIIRGEAGRPRIFHTVDAAAGAN